MYPCSIQYSPFSCENPDALVTARFFKFRFTCTICHHFYKNPQVISKCAHIFCQTCISTKKECPTCHISINATDITPGTEVKNEMKFTRTICAYEIELSTFMEKFSSSVSHLDDYENYIALKSSNINFEEKVNRFNLLIIKHFKSICSSKNANSLAIVHYSGTQWGLGRVQKADLKGIEIKMNSTQEFAEQTIRCSHANTLLIPDALISYLHTSTDLDIDVEEIDTSNEMASYEDRSEEIGDAKKESKNIIELLKLSERIIFWYQSGPSHFK